MVIMLSCGLRGILKNAPLCTLPILLVTLSSLEPLTLFGVLSIDCRFLKNFDDLHVCKIKLFSRELNYLVNRDK